MKSTLCWLRLFVVIGSVTSGLPGFAVPVVSNVKMEQIANTKQMAVSYDLADSFNDTLYVELSVTANGVELPVKTVSGDVGSSVAPGKGKHMVWDAGADWGGRYTEVAQAHVRAFTKNYCVVDLSAGNNAAIYPVTYMDAPPRGGWDKTYKTTKLVLRRIPAGTFVMGSPKDEEGRNAQNAAETLHQVTLTRPFYIGVFELTQKQYELVMGSNPSEHKGDARPAEKVTYNDIRGQSPGTYWPKHDEVDTYSFMGKLRDRTGLRFDLPTRARWEYACRAGTTTPFYNGKGYTDESLKEIARYSGNTGDGKGDPSYVQHTVVGSYKPNAWGLYDMLGNVQEWVLDHCFNMPDPLESVDPKGGSPDAYSTNVSHYDCGGSFVDGRTFCRAASTSGNPAYTAYQGTGFRVCCSVGQ